MPVSPTQPTPSSSHNLFRGKAFLLSTRLKQRRTKVRQTGLGRSAPYVTGRPGSHTLKAKPVRTQEAAGLLADDPLQNAEWHDQARCFLSHTSSHHRCSALSFYTKHRAGRPMEHTPEAVVGGEAGKAISELLHGGRLSDCSHHL